MFRFILRLLLLTLISTAIYHLAGNYIPPKWYFENFYWLPCVIATVTGILHFGLMQRKEDSKKFIRYYMGSTGVKLFLYLLIILAFAFMNKQEAVPFALCFFFFYLCFTVFEVGISYNTFSKSTNLQK